MMAASSTVPSSSRRDHARSNAASPTFPVRQSSRVKSTSTASSASSTSCPSWIDWSVASETPAFRAIGVWDSHSKGQSRSMADGADHHLTIVIGQGRFEPDHRTQIGGGTGYLGPVEHRGEGTDHLTAPAGRDMVERLHLGGRRVLPLLDHADTGHLLLHGVSGSIVHDIGSARCPPWRHSDEIQGRGE